jgi:hypothetical protein
MHYRFTPIAASALALAIGVATAPGAFAKAHDQGQTATPGANVGAETVTAAQTLGGKRGNGKGPGDTPAGANPGNSENAGRKN